MKKPKKAKGKPRNRKIKKPKSTKTQKNASKKKTRKHEN